MIGPSGLERRGSISFQAAFGTLKTGTDRANFGPSVEYILSSKTTLAALLPGRQEQMLESGESFY
jgi:hypothetical protein